MSGIRYYRSGEARLARVAQADVDRAVEVLGARGGHLSAGPRELRRRWDTLLDELQPPLARPGVLGKLLRWAGLTRRTRAADAAMAALFPFGVPFRAGRIGLRFEDGGVPPVAPEDAMRGRLADALDDAYCILSPHEAARRTALRREFWDSAREESRRREFVARCLGRLG